MAKIKVKNPIVEIDGDEMARIIWAMIKEKLILPFLDVYLKYYDLGVQKRDETDDRITTESALAIQQHGVGVKCATITPDAERVVEYKLKKAWPSPNGQIRSILDGTVFRKPILVKTITPAVRSWKKPIILGRHAYGDLYRGVELVVDRPGKVEILYTPEKGPERRLLLHDFKGPGVVMGSHNLENRMRNSERPGYVLFLTDGLRTTGMTETAEILKNLAKGNDRRSRIFVFGVGDDVNTELLDRIAADHRGASSYIGESENRSGPVEFL